MIYVEELLRKAKKNAKLGLLNNKRLGTGDNLPERAIKRLFDAIERTKTGREKDILNAKTSFGKPTKRK